MTNDLKESSTDYLPSGYVQDEGCKTGCRMNPDGCSCGNNCQHGVYRVEKVGDHWQIVCANCNSTHVNPDELDEILDSMEYFCRGA